MTAQNPVFDLLGDGGHDIESLTAYALYKQHKRVWASEFEVEHGKAPDVADNRAFAKVASTHDQLERYRKDARDILIAFANETVESAREEIAQEAITARIERAAAAAGSHASIWRQVQSGVISSSIMTVILIVLAVGIRLSGVDLLDVLENLEPPRHVGASG